jgi:hypothetical protein
LAEVHKHSQYFFQKIPTPATKAVLSLASLGNATQTETILLMSHYPRNPKNVQPWLLLRAFFWQNFAYVYGPKWKRHLPWGSLIAYLSLYHCLAYSTDEGSWSLWYEGQGLVLKFIYWDHVFRGWQVGDSIVGYVAG